MLISKCMPGKIFSRKGQVSAPFELLIAVILMGFVITIGIYAMTTMEKQRCINETDKKLGELKEALETVAKAKGQFSLDFFLPRCGRDIRVRLGEYTDSYLCSIVCGGSRDICILLDYSAEGMPFMRKCINISTLTEFEGEPGSRTCPSREGLELQDWRVEDIRQGDYILVSAYVVTPAAKPTICAYLKEII